MSGTNPTESQNLAVIRRGYEAFAKSDIETLKTVFSANATWHAPETGVLPGNYQGAQAILKFFGQLAHETDGHDARRTPDNGRIRRSCIRFT
jgi:uncharacterized protein